MSDILLEGCPSKPLSAYLKSLGVLRLVAEQKDSSIRGAWRDGCFVLSGPMTKDELRSFFLDSYEPTPLVSPWNGGSGFYPGDKNGAVDALEQSTLSRLARYREVIAAIRRWPEFQELASLPPDKAKKRHEKILEKSKTVILNRCRAVLPECCLPWLDAVFSLRSDKPSFAPLLGTGGNDGNMEYINNFMQHVAELFLHTPAELQSAWLDAALFGVSVQNLPPSAVGQFDPGNAGGRNQNMGVYHNKTRYNPWDFLFLMEGTLLFAGALVRRSPEDPAQASFPFSVNSSLSAGFTSSSLKDKGRGEIWLPLWSHPASVRELRHLLGEGRASLNRMQVRDGLDFARAVSTLGVDRGIEAFERYNFLERRGQSYVAMPSGRVSVTYRPEVTLLDPVVRSLRIRFTGKENDIPAALLSARRRLSRAIFDCTRNPDARHFQMVSRELAHLDALPGLPKMLASPCAPLPAAWIDACDDGSPEVRLAAAVASLRQEGKLGAFRAHLAPVDPSAMQRWGAAPNHYLPWRGSLLDGLGKILLRRLILAQKYGVSPLKASLELDPADLTFLLEGRIDMALFNDLLRAFSLVRFSRNSPESWKRPVQQKRLPYALGLLKLLYSAIPSDAGLDAAKLHPETRIVMLLQAGRMEEACSLASQRIRAAGGGGLYLPSSFAESVRPLNSQAVLACLFVPVNTRKLLQHVRSQLQKT